MGPIKQRDCQCNRSLMPEYDDHAHGCPARVRLYGEVDMKAGVEAVAIGSCSKCTKHGSCAECRIDEVEDALVHLRRDLNEQIARWEDDQKRAERGNRKDSDSGNTT